MSENMQGQTQENFTVKKNYIWVGLVLIILGIGAYVGYSNYISKPEYVLSKVLGAYEKKDIGEFEKYVEVDDFSYKLWTDYKEWLRKNIGCLWWPIRSNLDSSDAVKLAIRNVVDGKKTLEDLDVIEEDSSTTISIATIMSNMHDWKILTVSDNGDSKKFRVAAKTYDEKEFVFDFTMEKKNDYWAITKLNNLGEICETFEEFSKESIINYLKNSQEIQNEYLKQKVESSKLRGAEYYKANRDVENDRMLKLEDFTDNPFSKIINGNRILYSYYRSKYYDILLQKSIDETKRNDQDLLKEEKEAYNKSNDYNKRIEGLIKGVGYEEK